LLAISNFERILFKNILPVLMKNAPRLFSSEQKSMLYASHIFPIYITEKNSFISSTDRYVNLTEARNKHDLLTDDVLAQCNAQRQRQCQEQQQRVAA
jgi:hypothetical protein